ncbi:MAG: M28 family metallopeptidase [Acidobacteria bacterium]|nr:M28 family metallopeptidase [Acidobacteriota bacterium]MBI3661550.1 M28 family metallopeptidase [Acidobacteriota bacterium]
MKRIHQLLIAIVMICVPVGSVATSYAQKAVKRKPATAPAVEPALAATGYTLRNAADELRLEQKFAAIPSASEAKRHHLFLTAEPHPAGSARNNLLARHIAELWKLQGWEDVVIHRYDVLQSSPREVALEMVAPVAYKAALREDEYDFDTDTKNAHVSGAYLGFSASGEVTAPVVYANSGSPQDYDLLRKNGIDVKGKIVLVRYSNPYSYRGFKALTAQREGAAAILIYSDPAEDGYKRGKVYPNGPWGPESHIQRGAITYDFIVPGDPLTPGWASLPDAKRIPVEEAQSVPKIIAIPLSWRDAKPLLANMDGPLAPPAWQGGLPIKYRLGGSAVRVRLKADMDTSVVPNYVVEGRIRGAELPDEWIVLGNHRDAWVFGGVDPSSGTASQLELTRALGELKNRGIRPRRTIVMCSWDGEEYGLTGSTEWGEHFQDELRRKGVAYINVDSSASGPNFEPSSVPSLAPLLVEISRTLSDPSGKSLYAAWRETVRKTKKKAAVTDAELVNPKIGSGSDHTVFLNHVGMSSVLLDFNGPYGVYHSVYDNHFWMNKFGDPGFKYHALMSQFWGVLALRLANADILPFDFASYASSLRDFVQELNKGANAKTEVDLKPLLARIAEFEAAARELNATAQRVLSQPKPDAAALARLNAQLLQVERNWLHEPGIPGREWFKHLLYAARYTYAHLELPGLTEAMEAGKRDVAKDQARILEEAVAKNTALLRGARAGIEALATNSR